MFEFSISIWLLFENCKKEDSSVIFLRIAREILCKRVALELDSEMTFGMRGILLFDCWLKACQFFFNSA